MSQLPFSMKIFSFLSSVLLFLTIFVPYADAGSQTFTSNGTFVVPSGVTSISVTASAGGGGGANAFAAGHPMIGATYYNGAGGGSGAILNNSTFTVVPGSSHGVVIGTGGSGTTNGGNTSVGTLLNLNGGQSSYYQGSTVFQVGSGGAPGGQNGGPFTCAGATGSMSCPTTPVSVGSNGGSNTVGGVPGTGGSTGSCAPTAGTRGAGGGGQAYGCLGLGAAGGAGFVTITWAEPTGTITVTASIPGASYTLTGPSTLTGSGLSTTHTNVDPGTYTITWNPVVGYTTPPTSSRTLVSGSTQSFSGTYTLAPTVVELNFGP